MANITSPHTPDNWGAVSRGYAEFAPLMMGTYAGEVVDRLEVDEGMSVLEVAAGTGALTETLAQSAGSVLATDFAPGMVEVLEERLHRAGIDNVTCKVMDGMALEVEDESFDRAVCCFGVMLFPDRVKGCSELCRALRPGGRAVVTGWAGIERFEAFAIFVEGMRAAFPDMPPPPGPPVVLSLADPASFEQTMRAGGFDQAEVSFAERTLEIETFDSFWGMMTVGAPPVKLMFDRIGEAGKNHLRDTLAGIVEERFGSGPIRLKNTATIGVGIRSD